MNGKRLVGNLLLAGAASVITLVIIDGALRVAGPVGPRSGTFKPKPEARPITSRTTVFQAPYSGTLASHEFRVRVEVDSLGFRERGLDLSGHGPRSILFLGDSYIFGWGVERGERMTEHLAASLRREGVEDRVVNLAFPGWGSWQSYDVLRTYGDRLHPDLVVLGFFVGNDFLDDALAMRTPKEGTQSPPRRSLRARIREILRTSPTVNLARQALWRVPRFRSLFNGLELRNDRMVLYLPASSPYQQELYRASFQALDSLAARTRERDIPLLVVILPDPLQVLDPQVFAKAEIGRPQRMLEEHLHGIGVPYVDLLPLIDRAPDPAALYFRQDKHWTPAGQAFVAQALEDRVLALLRDR